MPAPADTARAAPANRCAFTDATGREWVVRVTAADLGTVREATGSDLGAVRANAENALALLADRFKFGATVYALCHAQAVARKVEPEEFAKLLVAVDVGAARALLHALADWCGGAGAVVLRRVARGLARECAALDEATNG